MKNFLSISFLALSLSLFSQKSKIDSLENLLKIAKEDTNKVILLNEISWKYYEISNFKTSTYFCGQSLKLAQQLNFPIGLAISYRYLGLIYEKQSVYDSALFFLQKSKQLCETTGRKRDIALLTGDIGKVYYLKGDVATASGLYLKSIKLLEETGDSLAIAVACEDFADILVQKNELQSALIYFKKSFSLKEEIGLRNRTASALGGIALIYFYQKKYKDAIDYFTKTLEIDKSNKKISGMAINLNNIGSAYDELGEYDKSLEYYFQALKISKEYNIPDQITMNLYNIGYVYGKQKKFSEAIKYLNEGLEIARKINSLFDLKNSYQYLSETFQRMNDYRNAYEFHKKYSEIKDSLLNEESSRQITEMQTKYESEKKQKEIVLLQKNKELQDTELAKKKEEVKKQNTQKIAFGAGLVLVLILALVIFRGYKQKEKSNLLLARQKQQIEIKNSRLEGANAEIRKQKNEIVEKNHEILASIRYAKRIQEAILPPSKLVKEYLPDSFVLYKPKDIVAGDFYWMSPTPRTGEGRAVLFACCDCTGHGVPGAFVSIVGHNALNQAVKEFGLTKPSAILDKLNELVDETFSKGENEMMDGMDIALCSLSLTGNRWSLEYAGANNSIYFIRNRELKEIKADKQPIGKFFDRKPFTQHEIEIQKGDTIYAFSDGYADQFGGLKGKKFKYKQFEELLLSIQDKTMTEQREILNDAIDNWRGDLEQIDDICIIGAKI